MGDNLDLRSLHLYSGNIEEHYERIEKSISYTMKQYNLDAYRIDIQDLRQDVWEKILIDISKKESVNLEYIKLVIKHKISNVIRRAKLEAKHSLHTDDFQVLEEKASYSKHLAGDSLENVYCLLYDIDDYRQSLTDPLEKAYFEIYLGNIGIPGFEEHAVISASEKGGLDFLTAKKLGFSSNKLNQYVLIKEKVKDEFQIWLEDYSLNIAC